MLLLTAAVLPEERCSCSFFVTFKVFWIAQVSCERRGSMEADGPDGTGPRPAEQIVDFGWEDDTPMSGRRQKKEREQKRKLKPGSFGECGALLC